MTKKVSIPLLEREYPLGRIVHYRKKEYFLSGRRHEQYNTAKAIALRFREGDYLSLIVKARDGREISYYVYIVGRDGKDIRE